MIDESQVSNIKRRYFEKKKFCFIWLYNLMRFKHDAAVHDLFLLTAEQGHSAALQVELDFFPP
jgi:hypothetical protein